MKHIEPFNTDNRVTGPVWFARISFPSLDTVEDIVDLLKTVRNFMAIYNHILDTIVGWKVNRK